MKLFTKPLLFGLLVFSCTAINQSGALQIPDDTKPVKIVKRADMLKKSDPLNIKHAEQSGDYVVFDVSYSGGCADHFFDLISTGDFTPTYPPEVEIALKHDKNGDGCRSVIDTKLYFDLRPLQNPATTQVLMVIKNSNKTLEYNY